MDRWEIENHLKHLKNNQFLQFQIEYIHNHEVQQLKNQIAQVYKSMNQAMPKFCYIIVNKRVNGRLFANNRNPPPGTVVDDVITLPER